MATRTSVADGKWSVAGTWDTGVPANTDTVIIAAGTSVEFDVDQTAFAAGVDLTINGTLYASTTAGSYVLKMSANMDGAGTLRAGTSTVAYPQTCTFEIMRGGFEITATNLTLDINCTEPTYRYIRTTGVAAVGQTVIEVDTSVIGDIWKAGDTIEICDVNGLDAEIRTIAAGGIAVGSITITAGLTNEKITGALVVLVTRNVKISHTADSGTAINGGTGHRIYAWIVGFSIGMASLTNCLVGGTIGALSNATGSCFNWNDFRITFSGVIYSANFPCSSVTGMRFTSTSLVCGTRQFQNANCCLFEGLIAGNAGGFLGCYGSVVTGTIYGNGTGIYSGSIMYLFGAILGGNRLFDIGDASIIIGYGASLNSATQVSTITDRGAGNYIRKVVMWDIGGVAGAYKAWMYGGMVLSQAGIVPPGRTVAYQHVPTSASYPVWMDRFAEVEPGATITITAYLRKDAAMAYLPRVQLFRIEDDPLLGGATLDADTMTDSIDTWETLSLEWTNSTVGPVTVVVRTLAQNASGNVYADSLIVNGGSTGGGGGARWISGEAIGYIG